MNVRDFYCQLSMLGIEWVFFYVVYSYFKGVASACHLDDECNVIDFPDLACKQVEEWATNTVEDFTDELAKSRGGTGRLRCFSTTHLRGVAFKLVYGSVIDRSSDLWHICLHSFILSMFLLFADLIRFITDTKPNFVTISYMVVVILCIIFYVFVIILLGTDRKHPLFADLFKLE